MLLDVPAQHRVNKVFIDPTKRVVAVFADFDEKYGGGTEGVLQNMLAASRAIVPAAVDAGDVSVLSLRHSVTMYGSAPAMQHSPGVLGAVHAAGDLALGRFQ